MREVTRTDLEGFRSPAPGSGPQEVLHAGRVYVVIDERTGTIATTSDTSREASAKKIHALLQEKGSSLSQTQLQLIIDHARGCLVEKSAKNVTAPSRPSMPQAPTEKKEHLQNLMTARHLSDQSEVQHMLQQCSHLETELKGSQKETLHEAENSIRNFENFLTILPPCGDPSKELSYSRCLSSFLDTILEKIHALHSPEVRKHIVESMNRIRAGWHQVSEALSSIGVEEGIYQSASTDEASQNSLAQSLKKLRIQSYGVDPRNVAASYSTVESLRGGLRFLGDLLLLRSTKETSAYFDDCVKKSIHDFELKLQQAPLPDSWNSWKSKILETLLSADFS